MSSGGDGSGDSGKSRVPRAARSDFCPKRSERQYTRELLFSQVVALMVGVATRTHTSVHGAYLAAKDRLAVSTTALYNKLNRLEPGISAAMIRETSQDAAQVINAMPGACRELLPGYHVQYLDGNHLAATEHRLAELRVHKGRPLAGADPGLVGWRSET